MSFMNICILQSVMERLSRFLQADIVPSIDSIVTIPALGFCHTFSVANYALPSGETKTMLCFDGCATHLGCSITLRGGSMAELKKVNWKHIQCTIMWLNIWTPKNN